MAIGDLYQCAHCKGVFRKGRPDEEARTEFEQRHAGSTIPEAEIAVICDDCFDGYAKWFATLTPEQRAEIERSGDPEPPFVHVTTHPLTEQDKKERRINTSISIWKGTEGSG